MERLELPIGDLDLDLKNPRIDIVESEPEAINAIVLLDFNHFCNMMESIRDHGLDPGDSFYVIAEGGEENYTVVDGNRRLAALKMLRNPEISKRLEISAGQARRITNVSKTFDKKKHEHLDCVLFDSREQANSWILRRHGRGLDGEGRIPWGTLEIERFKQDGSVLDVIDFVERNLPDDAAGWPETKKKLQRASSTLRRIIESKRGREWLGLTIEESNGIKIPFFTLNPSAALRILQKIFDDIKSKSINTRSLIRQRKLKAT
ncbi:hypothetical protein MBRA_00222 [Methylobacterium brachiatum]|nr:hypothetical protein MBRA_00222 [Methylobacterium brachiatum]